MSRRLCRTLIAAAAAAMVVGASAGSALAANEAATGAGASASNWYLSRGQAASITGTVVRRNAAARVDSVQAACTPSFRRASARNLRLRWHLWDCGWSAGLTKTDGSKGLCAGRIRVIGKVRGAKYSVLRRSVCRQVSGPTPPPTPSPTPTPTPTPPSSGGSGGGPAQQDILNHTIAWAGELGRSFVSPVTHTFTSTVNGCKMIKADTGRCTIWRWVDAGIVGSDSGREVHRIDFYRVYAFSQWVTTSGIYDDYSQTFDIIDPAQSCLTVDNQNLYGCTPLVPGAG